MDYAGEPTVAGPFASVLAQHLRQARVELTAHWLGRISERVTLAPTQLFPSENRLDDMPVLIDGVAHFISDPARAVGTDAGVVLAARKLGALRYEQGFDEYEILKEFEIFGGILFAFVARTASQVVGSCTTGELAVCCQRLFQAVAAIEQATAVQFHQLVRARVAEREQRLRLFNRALSHELRNQIGTALGAGEILMLADITESKRQEFAGIVVRNLSTMRGVLDNLLELTRVGETNARQHRHVRLPDAASEAVRTVRDTARGDRVEVRVAPSLPEVEVNAAAVELSLTNLLSNAIKYADPTKPERWVEVTGRLTEDGPDGGSVVVEVRDNGLGVPPGDRRELFQRLFRARTEASERIRGTGLGLSIVRETVESLGGRVWADFPPEGSVFAFSLPCRRASDAGGATTVAAEQSRARPPQQYDARG